MMRNDGESYPGLAATPGYRYADEVADRLFVAGQVPHDADANLVGMQDAKAQARQCLHNLFTLVAAHGFSPDDIHHLTVYVVGERQNLLDAWDGVSEWFHGNVPPATLLGVARLGYEQQLVEVDATIARG
jgi:enamine deaminase RidA (YjgF/YER057c/UK114 family)